MRIERDEEGGFIYINEDLSYDYSVNLGNGIIIDFDKDKQLIGVEYLLPSFNELRDSQLLSAVRAKIEELRSVENALRWNFR